jgi:hypothetical protein
MFYPLNNLKTCFYSNILVIKKTSITDGRFEGIYQKEKNKVLLTTVELSSCKVRVSLLIYTSRYGE